MILCAKNLKKSYKSAQTVTVLSDVSLSLEYGKSLAICGRSGEGKTTLLHILGTLEFPEEGSVTIEGVLCTPSNAAKLRRHSIGFIFQSFHLLEDFTVLENVLMPAHIARRKTERKEGLDLLDAVGLVERADFPVGLLSGGEKQRVAIARALCNKPNLILADEPSGNLDAASAASAANLLFSLVKEHCKSLILVTHDPTLAALCDTTHVLHEGTLDLLRN
ncbi:MAG: ABC transporter ATP-binding protein [Chlamydiia bacterium]|nr:ABC transporter ATP-binding protein [Chlamydiia bacterium]